MCKLGQNLNWRLTALIQALLYLVHENQSTPYKCFANKHRFFWSGSLLSPVFSTAFELRGADLPFFSCAEKIVLKIKKKVLLLKFDGCIFMAYGVILKHLKVDKITRGSFSKKKKKI
jgi:hypothetical protein